MSRLKFLIKEKLGLIVKCFNKNYPKIFSIITSIALIIYFCILFRIKSNQKHVPINELQKINQKFSGNSFPNKKCNKKSRRKKEKFAYDSKKQKKVQKGIPSNENNQEKKEITKELETENIDNVNGRCLLNYWIDFKKLIISFIYKKVIIIIDKIKQKKDPIKIEQNINKRKTEEFSENIINKIYKKDVLNNENVLEKKEEKIYNINKFKEEKNKNKKVKKGKEIKLNEGNNQAQIHNEDLKKPKEKVNQDEIEKKEIQKENIQKQNKNQIEKLVKELIEAKKEVINKEEKSEKDSQNKIIIKNNNENLKIQEKYNLNKIKIERNNSLTSNFNVKEPNVEQKNEISEKKILEYHQEPKEKNDTLNGNNQMDKMPTEAGEIKANDTSETEKKNQEQNTNIKINLAISKNISEINVNENSDLVKILSALHAVNNILINLFAKLSNLVMVISDKINFENVNCMNNKIKSNIIKISNIFRFLNNIRLILLARKYVNKIIINEVNINPKIKISQSSFLNDLIGFKFKNDENKLKIYVSKFIVQIGKWKLSQNIYNLVLDFLYYLKSYFNDSVHFVNISEDITSNKLYSSIFYDRNNNKNIAGEINSNFRIIDYKNSNNIRNNNNIITNENKEHKNIIILEKTKKIELITKENINNTNIKFEDLEYLKKSLKSVSDNIIKIKNKFSDEKLESKLIEEFSINNEKEEENINYTNFSIHDLKNDSLDNYKKIFIEFFYKNDLKNIDKNNSKIILENEKEEIINEYSKINEITKESKIILNKLFDSLLLSKKKNSDLVNNIIEESDIIQQNINEIIELNNQIEKKASEYYELFFLSIAYKVKANDLEEKFLKDKNVLAFENIFLEWKNSFDENYIIGLKKKYGIDKTINTIELPKNSKLLNKNNNINRIEYLKTSKLYNAFIDKEELSNMDSIKMIEYIDNITKGIDIEIFDTDEEINYKKLECFDEKIYEI